MANARAAREPHLWDARRQLSAGARAALEAQLSAAERKAGVPFFLLVTERLRGQPAAELARDAFAEHGLGKDPAQNSVLLVVATDSGAAAVETGKGSAGIVPELDARRIVKELSAHVSSRRPERAIALALTQLAASARATAARRTPLPSPPREPDAPDDSAEPAALAADAGTPDGDGARDGAAPASLSDGGPAAGGTAQPVDGAPKRGGRSRLPIAVGLGVLVLLGLGLRRRRQIAASRTKESEAATKRPRPRF